MKKNQRILPWYTFPLISTSYDSMTSWIAAPTSQRRTSIPASYTIGQNILVDPTHYNRAQLAHINGMETHNSNKNLFVGYFHTK